MKAFIEMEGISQEAFAALSVELMKPENLRSREVIGQSISMTKITHLGCDNRDEVKVATGNEM